MSRFGLQIEIEVADNWLDWRILRDGVIVIGEGTAKYPNDAYIAAYRACAEYFTALQKEMEQQE